MPTADDDALLDEGTVVGYLTARGLIADAADVTAVHALGGGVSNVVLRVDLATSGLVVKQSLEHLRVESDWSADRTRVLTEAAALRLAGQLSPGTVPDVLDVDDERCVIAIAAAPDSWRAWKDDLLAGRIDPAIAGSLGHTLGTWHADTLDDPAIAQRFDHATLFDQLRVDPYHRAVMAARPEAAAAVQRVVDTMADSRHCLVHGDFSPKNILVGGDTPWVIDFEVAHYGDPTFDTAFLLSHLVLKSIHVPGSATALDAAAQVFLASYRAAAGPVPAGPDGHLSAQLGALLLARVDGKSPAEYLTEAERPRVRALGLALVTDRPHDPLAAWPKP